MRTSSVGKASRATQAGITLIEMMVVMTIIALIVAISAPSVSAGIDSVRMASAASSVASFLNAAVNRAERRQQPIQLIISPRQSSMTIYSNEPGFERGLKMPDGISIETVLPKTEEPEYRVTLMPGASVPGIGIQLANSRGGRRIVRLDPMTGFPRVESVPSE
jgi:prepilin-type N-terminal cleavage/methylation domain-containing protein